MKEQFEETSCAICDSKDLYTVTDKGQFGFTTNVCICKNCGMSFLNPRWNQATYLDFYTNHYDKYFRPDSTVEVDPKKAPGNYFPIMNRIKELHIPLKEGFNLLDVGSGDGSKVIQMANEFKHINYYAIEPSEAYRKRIEERGIHFVSTDVNSDWDKDYKDTFDIIIMRHVLEHMLNPVEVLKKLRAVLKETGVVYIAVPDSLNIKVNILTYFFRVVHTYYFTRISLTNTLRKAGFEVQVLKEGDRYHTHELYVFAKKSTKELALEIDSKNFTHQLQAYIQRIKDEKSISFRSYNGVIKMAIKLKKMFFPKPFMHKQLLK